MESLALKQKTKNTKSGFTLVELMTVMAIIFIMSVLAVSNYRQGGNQVVLDVEASRIAQDFRRAQEWSMAAHQMAGVAKKGYGIYASAVSGSYIIFVDNNGNGGYDVSASPSELYETVVLDKRVEISLCNPNPASVDFMVTSPVTKINGGDATTVQKVQIWLKSNHNMKRTVTVNKAGLIYVE